MALLDPEVMEINEDPLLDWRVLYLNYLVRETLPVDKTKARWLACRAKSYIIIKGELYKKSHTKVSQRCIPTEQGRKLLEDIHRGACSHHATLIRNAF
jgi:hypothetical protein